MNKTPKPQTNTKISSTACRVLLLMMLLIENNYSLNELAKLFFKDPLVGRSFTKEAMLKYINTLRISGMNVTKSVDEEFKNKYILNSFPCKIALTKEEAKAFAIIENYVNNIHQNKLKKSFYSYTQKIERFLDENSKELLKSERKKTKNKTYFDLSEFDKYSELIKKFEQYCIEDQRILIKYQLPGDVEQQYTIEPETIRYDRNNVCITGYNPILTERQFFYIKYINDIKQLPQKSKYHKISTPVLFKIKGRLANNYRLYEDEKITESDEDSITITSHMDEKNLLLQRLMKYGDLCEVIYPKSIRYKFEENIKNTLANYITAE